MSGLQIKYKTPSGDVQPIRNVRDLRAAINDLQEIYLNLDGEVNEFEPRTPSTTSYSSTPSPAPTPAPAPVPAPVLPPRAGNSQQQKPAVQPKPTQSNVASNTAALTRTYSAVTPSPSQPEKKTIQTSASVSSFVNKPQQQQQQPPPAVPALKPKKPKKVWQECYTEEGEKYHTQHNKTSLFHQ